MPCLVQLPYRDDICNPDNTAPYREKTTILYWYHRNINRDQCHLPFKLGMD